MRPPLLRALAATAFAAVALPAVLVAQDGAALYARCAACHQANGTGVPGAFPPLAGSEWVVGKPDAAIRILLHGVQGALTVKGVTYNQSMPAYGTGQIMTDAEVAAVLTYVRTSFGNKASAVTAAQVAGVRAATKGRKAQWMEAELKPFR
ncbi:MAG: cytochrome c [Gemmatimonadaceae bacterium]|nr:cytochrome c [Gemmatimonadaceae bacterium]